MGFAIVGVQWLIEQLCFQFTFVLGDSEVLLIARHRKPFKRYRSFYGDSA